MWGLYDGPYESPYMRLATDLAGTAHSFMGATLASAIVDLGSLWQVPTHDAQLTGYVCASRVRRVTDLVVAHPYSPELFTQGDLTRPKLLLDFQRGHKSVEDVNMAWAQAARAAQNRTRARDWPANLNLICISCAITIETAEEIKRPLWSFRGRGSNDLEIVQAGMDRMCKTCREKFTQKNVTQTQDPCRVGLPVSWYRPYGSDCQYTGDSGFLYGKLLLGLGPSIHCFSIWTLRIVSGYMSQVQKFL